MIRVLDIATAILAGIVGALITADAFLIGAYIATRIP